MQMTPKNNFLQKKSKISQNISAKKPYFFQLVHTLENGEKIKRKM